MALQLFSAEIAGIVFRIRMFRDQIVGSAVTTVADLFSIRNRHPFLIPFTGIAGGAVRLCGLDESTCLQRLFRLCGGRRRSINHLFGICLFCLLSRLLLPGCFLSRFWGAGSPGRRRPFRHIRPGSERRGTALLVFLFAALHDCYDYDDKNNNF